MPAERQTKLDGVLLYGFVNLSPSPELTVRARRTPDLEAHCARKTEDWCRNPETFAFVNLLLMNTYTGGLRSVGSFIPLKHDVKRGDIVVVRFRATATAEFIRIASRGESSTCRWEGGGIGRALTSAGVICEDYDWRELRSYFYN
jgi:hypothetical protein